MLAVIFSFAFVGLVSRRFGARQQVVVTVAAICLAGAQYAFSRFL